MIHSAVVFAYHNVGVRGLASLLANDIQVKLVVTHADNPQEHIWFGSVRELAELNDIPVICPDDPNAADAVQQIREMKPDWFFSFYYRNMLGRSLLDIPLRGALNLHGSLLPRYRGRVPVNWAVFHGEKETGASLHRMEVKPDAGALIDQLAVPILPNDTAHLVFQKVTCAAEIVLMRSLPGLLQGTQDETPLDLSAGSYFGGRKPEDGRINWLDSAQQVHNLVRAVAPPYPPAFFDIGKHRVHIPGSYYLGEAAVGRQARIYWVNNRCYADCTDGCRFQITGLDIDGREASQAVFEQFFDSELILS